MILSSWSSCLPFPPSARVAGMRHLIVFGWHPVVISSTPDCRLSSLLYFKIYFVLNYVSMCVCPNRSVSVSAGILASQKRATDPMSWSYKWPWATSCRCKRPDYHLLQEPQVLFTAELTLAPLTSLLIFLCSASFEQILTCSECVLHTFPISSGFSAPVLLLNWGGYLRSRGTSLFLYYRFIFQTSVLSDKFCQPKACSLF